MSHQHSPSTHQHDHDGGDTEMDMGHGMAMSFHTGTSETILFSFWNTENNTGAFVGSLFIIFFMAFGYEALKCLREVLYKTSSARDSNPANVSLLGTTRYRMLNQMHALQTILHMFQFVLSYFLMLIFMTYNVWLGIAVTLGAGVGYFCFGWNKNMAIDVTDHCH